MQRYAANTNTDTQSLIKVSNVNVGEVTNSKLPVLIEFTNGYSIARTLLTKPQNPTPTQTLNLKLQHDTSPPPPLGHLHLNAIAYIAYNLILTRVNGCWFLICESIESSSTECAQFHESITPLVRQTYGRVAHGVVDTRIDSDVASKLNIANVPVALVFHSGKVVQTYVTPLHSSSPCSLCSVV
jgi:hypothetical protein